jgi:hypothetical protein
MGFTAHSARLAAHMASHVPEVGRGVVVAIASTSRSEEEYHAVGPPP